MSQRGILLDTCVFSEFVKRDPDTRVVRWLFEADDLALSVGVVIEIEKGIALLGKQNSPKAAVLRAYLDLALSLDLTLLASDRHVARLTGQMMSRPELRNAWMDHPGSRKPKFAQDIHIAAAAIAHGYALATFDVADFERIDRWFPLPGLINPRKFVGRIDGS